MAAANSRADVKMLVRLVVMLVSPFVDFLMTTLEDWPLTRRQTHLAHFARPVRFFASEPLGSRGNKELPRFRALSVVGSYIILLTSFILGQLKRRMKQFAINEEQIFRSGSGFRANSSMFFEN